MLEPQNIHINYAKLFADIDNGAIKIPKFQRDFVWSEEQTAKLLDSMLKGFPVGTLIFWKTKERLRHIKEIGNIKLPPTPRGDMTNYVLDGQQRITSLYCVKKGLIDKDNGGTLNYHNITIDLAINPKTDEQICHATQLEGQSSISVYNLLNASVSELANNYNGKLLERIDVYRNRLTQFDFPLVV